MQSLGSKPEIMYFLGVYISVYATFSYSFRTRGNDSGKSAEEERDEWCKVSANWGRKLVR